MNTTTTDTTKLSAIDKALAAAKARKAAAASVADAEPKAKAPTTEKKPKAERPARPDADARAAAKAERAEAAKADAAKRAEARAAKKAEKAAARAAEAAQRGPANMKKVERAASKLPKLTSEAQLSFNELIGGFSSEQLAAIALHLQHHNRFTATRMSTGAKSNHAVGDTVQVVGGAEPLYVGLTGTVTKVARIRSHVEVRGAKGMKTIYIFNSDLRKVDAPAKKSAAAG